MRKLRQAIYSIFKKHPEGRTRLLKLLLIALTLPSIGSQLFNSKAGGKGLAGSPALSLDAANLSPDEGEEGQLDLASLYKSKVKRTTELGKAIPVELKGQEEVRVILKDPAISSMWGLKTTDAQRAWRVTTGSKDIVVAVIDTGIDVQHPDLTNNLWVNQGETGLDAQGRNKATNGVDDDGNGFVDDVHGWNFVSNTNDLTDNHGHGTHIAGIVGAEGGNGIGISGVAPKVSLMILKYYDPKASGMNNLVNTIRAIRYAVQMNANIINYSGGGTDPNEEERKAVEFAAQRGILFVAAAGNERSNSDIKGYYPADYDLPNIISVTAIDRSKTVLPTSNYGERSVHIAAPGNDILSTLPGGKYGPMTGTSQATAFASGVAALVMANNSELRKADRIVKYLTQTGDSAEQLVGKTRYQKILNSYKALAIQDRDLSVTGMRVENTLHMREDAFASSISATSSTANPERNIAEFGKALEKLVTNESARTSPKKLVDTAPGI